MTPVILIEFEDEFFLEAMDLVLNQRKKKQKKKHPATWTKWADLVVMTEDWDQGFY